MSRLLLLPPLLLAACATPRGEGVRAQAPDTDTHLAAAPPSTEALREALERFSLRAAGARQALGRGAPMPPSQVEAWKRLSLSVRLWLATSRPDAAQVAAVQRTLEAELAADARAYGDVPAGLAEQVMGTLDALAARLPPAAPPRRAPAGRPLRLSWPLEGLAVTSDFGPRRHPLHREVRMHAGVDLAARPHQRVLAAAPGRVVRVGWNGGHGLQVELLHAGGLRTRYSHLSQAVVGEGDALARGDVLGLAGRTGRTTGVHLHFEVWLDGEPLDPLELLDEEAPPDEALTVSRRWPD